jgi:hypothetical protein
MPPTQPAGEEDQDQDEDQDADQDSDEDPDEEDFAVDYGSDIKDRDPQRLLVECSADPVRVPPMQGMSFSPTWRRTGRRRTRCSLSLRQ